MFHDHIILSELPFFEAHSLGGPKLLMPCWGQATSYMHFVMQWMHTNPKVQLILIRNLWIIQTYPERNIPKRPPTNSLCFRIPFVWWWKGIHEVCSRGMFGWNLQHVKCTSLKIQRLLLPSRSKLIDMDARNNSVYTHRKHDVTWNTTNIAGLWLLAKNMLSSSYSECVWGCCFVCIPRGWTSSTDSVTHVFFCGSCLEEKNFVFLVPFLIFKLGMWACTIDSAGLGPGGFDSPLQKFREPLHIKFNDVFI